MADVQASAKAIVTPTDSDTGLFVTSTNLVRRFLFSAIPFLASGAGAALRLLRDKARESVSVADFYRPDLGDTSYSPALARAIAAGYHTVTVPAGTWTFLTPVPYSDHLTLIGAGPTNTDGGSTVIQANAGFLVNASSTVRQRLTIKNLYIIGNKTAGVAAIDGPFGGSLIDCRIENFVHCVRNTASYLSRYIRCSFAIADWGLNLADAHGTRIEDCHFAASVRNSIDLTNLTPVSPGVNMGTPMIITGNNFNTANVYFSNYSAVILRGNITFTGNYFEDFTTSGASNVKFVELQVNRFDECGFQCFGNEFNGQGNTVTGIYINGSHAGTLSNACYGEIHGNRQLGLTNFVEFGANNNVPFLRIYDNNDGTIINRYARSIYRPMVTGYWTTSTTVSGATWVDLPISTNQPVDNCDGFASNQLTARKAGYYDIDCAVAGADCELRILVNGVTEILALPAGIQRIGMQVNLALADTLKIQARNGTTVTGGYFKAKWEGDGHS